MLNTKKIKLDKALYERAQRAAQQAGYSHVDEFIQHAVERALSRLENPDETKEVGEKLKGLGYF